MRRRDLTHVHVHFSNPAADVAMLAARFGGDGWHWSLTLHGPAEFFEVSGNRLVEKLASAQFVACASDWSRSQAMSLLPSADWGHLRLVRGGVDSAAWSRPSAPAAGDALRVLNVGRLSPVKGQALLVEAVAALRERGIEARAKIVGAGPEREALEHLIARLEVSDRVELTGAVGQDRVRELYAESDVFCLPSFREGLPFVAIEALSMELPVVTTRIMGIPELIEDGVSGLLVSPGRADQLTAALERLAGDPELRRALGKAGRATVQRDYELSRLAEEMRSAFEVPAAAAVSTNR
jgi:glycosyltransferase involved in cell wall biosynthesis